MGNGEELTLSQASRRAYRHQFKTQRGFSGKVVPEFSSFKKLEEMRDRKRAPHFLTGLTIVSQSLSHMWASETAHRHSTIRHHWRSLGSQGCYGVGEKRVESAAETRWVKRDPRKDKESRWLHKQIRGRGGALGAPPTFQGTHIVGPIFTTPV